MLCATFYIYTPCLFTSNLIHRSFFRLNRLNTGVSPMNKTAKISGASVNLTTPRIRRIGLLNR
jgi:hypothetical protein